jgi:hypothetical protein
MTTCCWFWESTKDTSIESLKFVDDIVLVLNKDTAMSNPKSFLSEYIGINATTFLLVKKSLDGKVQIVLTFYGSPGKSRFVRGFLYIGGKEYSIKTYNNNTFSLYN